MQPNRNTFTVSPKIIWLSSIFMAILASIPKVLQINITKSELAVDAGMAFIYTLFIWYYNLYCLPKFSISGNNQNQLPKKLILSLISGTIFMALIVALYHLIFSHYQFLPMFLMYQFRGILINLTIFLLIHFIYQSYDTQQVKLQLEKIKTDNLNAQYELLKQQVNPHFLFNSLNTLKSMIDVHDSQASDFVVKLSSFYRFSLESRRENVVSLDKEIAILEAYTFLLKSRFEDGFRIEISISDKSRKSIIPPFTMQLLIENSIKHNIVSLNKPIHISIFEDDNDLVIRNNIQPKKNVEQSSGIGLDNIKGRYAHLTDQHVKVIHDKEFFIVKLPLIYEYSHY
uniref:Histidine kinase n=1 Tax=Chryseobacterium vrystaatense TaxID=307480 RepID=A0A1M4Z795_9FLAO|nr:histidine kinase [Chryseobacterium vrystaatense]KFF27321.1 histidine kinase [Chryseobacterium vrystaatense]SHF13894.1 Histidine kinase [Chryseobacterium vrystaatense]